MFRRFVSTKAWIKRKTSSLFSVFFEARAASTHDLVVIRNVSKPMTSACVFEVCLDRSYEEQAGFTQSESILDYYGIRYAHNLSQVNGEDRYCIVLDADFLRRI